MCANSSGRATAISSAGGASLSHEVADGKISVESASAMNTLYLSIVNISRETEPSVMRSKKKLILL